MTKVKPVRVKIEIPKDSNVKYEYDKQNNVLVVDRILKKTYPFNYGFVPYTKWDDGDPLDVIVLGNFSLHPCVELAATPIALIYMNDNGESDDKLVVTVSDSDKLSYFSWRKIKKFLLTYKKGVIINGYTKDAKKIQEAVEKSIMQYCKK